MGLGRAEPAEALPPSHTAVVGGERREAEAQTGSDQSLVTSSASQSCVTLYTGVSAFQNSSPLNPGSI